METLLKIDSSILLWLNQWAGRFSLLDWIVKLLVGDYFIPVLLSLCLVGMWFVGKDHVDRDANQRAVIRAMIGLGFANLAVFVLNQHFFRARPFTQYELTLLFYQPTDSSFPANPAAFSFALACGVWQRSRKLGGAFYLVAALWSSSRVFAGVHYPSDVVAGALIGITISYLVALALRLIEPIPTLALRLFRMLHLA